MNRMEDQLQNLRDVRLPDDVRARMRSELLSYAQLHAAPTRLQSIRSPFSTFSFRIYAGLSTLLLIIAGLGGTAYASEQALPGDALYKVKLSIAEPLQTALVPSDRGKAVWHAILAERRLDETAQLAARGALSTSTQAELAANFDTHVSASEESADRLESVGDTNGSLTARTDLEARLGAHQRILSVIATHFATSSSPVAEETHVALSQMLAVVTDHKQAVTSARIALEDAIAPGVPHTDSEATSSPRKGNGRRIAMDLRSSHASPTAQVQAAAAARSAEEETIFTNHAALLAKFLPDPNEGAVTVSTTTSTTTVTTTSTTTQSKAGSSEATSTQSTQLRHSDNEELNQAELK